MHYNVKIVSSNCPPIALHKSGLMKGTAMEFVKQCGFNPLAFYPCAILPLCMEHKFGIVGFLILEMVVRNWVQLLVGSLDA